MTPTTPRRHLRRAVPATGVVAVTVVGTARPAAAFPGEGILRDAAGSAFDGITGAVTGWVLDAVGFFARGVLQFLGTAAEPDVTAIWFAGPNSPFATVRMIAGLLLVAFALLAVIQGVMRGDAGLMVGRVAAGIPAAVLATVAVTVVTAKLLELTDALSAAVLDPAGPAAERFVSGLTLTSTVTGTGFAVVLVAVLAAIAGLALWAELLIRAALVYVLVALSPLAFAAMVWPTARGAARRLTELLLAVILSKLVISIVLAIGVAAVGGVGLDAGDRGVGDRIAVGVGQLLIGAVLLALAAFAPFLTLRLFPLTEQATVAQGVSRAPIRTGISAFYLTNSATRLATMSTSAAVAGPVGAIPAAVTATRAATAAYDIGRTATTTAAPAPAPASGIGPQPEGGAR